MTEHPAREATGAAAGAGSVLVGIDGSDGSRAALDHAFDEAHWRGLPLVAVTAFEPPDLWVTAEGLVPPFAQLEHAARQLAQNVIDAVVSARVTLGAPVPEVHLLVRSGPASAVLETLSTHAKLLVVGHRGRGALTSRLLGSVGLSTVLHAACTVTVVRTPEPPAA
jgi:nucleotide-binding universal stress UspA family protein